MADDKKNKILKLAKIQDVVSDYVQLSARSDSSYHVGLCPFHQATTPTLYVFPERNFCICRKCGKGGSPLNFVMQQCNVSYNQALAILGKKYGIAYTDPDAPIDIASTVQMSEIEEIMQFNKFAADFYTRQLLDTTEGQDIALTYFRSRGFTDATIQEFALGYSPDNAKALLGETTARGFKPELIEKSGISPAVTNQDGKPKDYYDRYHSRVIFPIHDVTGNIVAFAGRVIKNVDHIKAKYVNSPETAVYHKSDQLYGLYQAKDEIIKYNKFFLVEGYTDVISMHQAGVKNVVASSGTALTEGQIALVKRFSNNATVLYDGDSAGINAALRGIDMLLKEGLNVKILLLPDGHDPDSFAKQHTADEFRQYIAQNEADFIDFKTRVLLRDAGDDPIRRVEVIHSVVESIACITDQQQQEHYIALCRDAPKIREDILRKEVANIIQANNEKLQKKAARAAEIAAQKESKQHALSKIEQLEQGLITLVVRYGLWQFSLANEGDGISVIDYIINEMNTNNLSFSNQEFQNLLDLSLQIIADEFEQEVEPVKAELAILREQEYNQECNAISADNTKDISQQQAEILKKVNAAYKYRLNEFCRQFISGKLLNHNDDNVRQLATSLYIDKYQLSKIHTKPHDDDAEINQLQKLVYNAIYGISDELIQIEIKQIMANLQNPQPDAAPDYTTKALERMKQLAEKRAQLSVLLGERVISPTS